MSTIVRNFRHVSFLQVKYRMDGDVAKTICHVDEKAKDIEHAKKVSQQVSKVRPCCGRRWGVQQHVQPALLCLSGGLTAMLPLTED